MNSGLMQRLEVSLTLRFVSLFTSLQEHRHVLSIVIVVSVVPLFYLVVIDPV